MQDLSLFSEDERFMNSALKEAKKAYDKKEVPVGAVLVHQGRIVARGYNQIEMLKDATAHAEIICLTAGSEFFNNWRLQETTLYCTLEPCCMCAGAMINARINRLVWAARDSRVGACGSWCDLFSKKHPIHQIEVEGGVLEKHARDLMQSFFQEVRNAKTLQ